MSIKKVWVFVIKERNNPEIAGLRVSEKKFSDLFCSCYKGTFQEDHPDMKIDTYLFEVEMDVDGASSTDRSLTNILIGDK